MQELRANTQVIVAIGPFVDVGDAFTPETGITLGAADEAELLKHGSTTTVDIAGNTWAAITGVDGHYGLTLSTTDTNTEGMLTVVVQDDSVCLPVKHQFMVLAEAAWDSKYVAKDDGFMDVNIKTIGRADTQETEASNLESACANYSATRGLTGTAVPAAAADAAGGLVISDAGGFDVDNRAMAAAAVTNANTVFNTDFASNYNTTADRWKSDLTHANGTAVSATNAVPATVPGYNIATGTIGSTGNDTTHLHLDGLTYGNDELVGYGIVILDVSESEYHFRFIDDWVLATELATVTTLPFTPQNATDQYWVVALQEAAGGSAPTALEVADAVWDEARAGHVAAGSFGEYVLADAVLIGGDATAVNGLIFAGSDYVSQGKFFAHASTIQDGAIANTTFTATALDGLITSSSWASGAITPAAFDSTAGPFPHLAIVDQGTAQSATSTTVVLRAAAAFADNTLIGSTIEVFGSTQGYWQSREIRANSLSSPADTVNVDAWSVTPTGTITYRIRAKGPTILGNVSHGGGAAILSLGTMAVTTNSIAWNTFWDPEIESECTDALNAYDPPTHAELTSGLASADDAVLAAINDLPTNAELATALGTADDAVLAAIAALNNVSNASVATAVLTTAMTEAYRATGATGTVAQVLYEILAHLGEFVNAGTTKTTKRLDGSTTAKTYTYDDANDPTSITEAT